MKRIEGIFDIETDVEEDVILNAFKQFMIENFQEFNMIIKGEKELKHKQEKLKKLVDSNKSEIVKVESKEEIQGVIG